MPNPLIDKSRLDAANQIMPLLLPSGELALTQNGIVVSWCNSSGKSIKRRWCARRGSFFPVFSAILPTGGTHITAIAQLVNWVRDRPCLPIQSWQYWCSEKIGMKHGSKILPILEQSDYPKDRKCFACGSSGSLDWYDFGKHSGLGCLHSCNELKLLLGKHHAKKPN
ncbi:MAG: hypothetical protein ACRC62_15520 [Microcoleus sp.]